MYFGIDSFNNVKNAVLFLPKERTARLFHTHVFLRPPRSAGGAEKMFYLCDLMRAAGCALFQWEEVRVRLKLRGSREITLISVHFMICIRRSVHRSSCLKKQAGSVSTNTQIQTEIKRLEHYFNKHLSFLRNIVYQEHYRKLKHYNH